MKNLIYFDNAATSFPKPQNVVFAVSDSINKCGNPGRGGHEASMYSLSMVHSCREEICSFFNFNHPENVVFTYNTTYALNMAINSFAKKDTEILISNFEHNSVLRPVYARTLDENRCKMKIFDASQDDTTTLENFKNALTDKTSLVVVTMCSNVTGKILPYIEISKICKQKGVCLVFDAAQLGGQRKIDLSKLYFDAVCFAGHKSLYGIMGVGFCIFSDNTKAKPLIFGGNGVESQNFMQTGVLPERLEAGTLAVPGIIALKEGLKYIESIGLDYIEQKCTFLDECLKQSLLNIKGVTLIGECKDKVPTFLFNVDKVACESVAEHLSLSGICVRAGYQCSPLAHQTLGTRNTGGVRISLSHRNTLQEIDFVSRQIMILAK